jgi:glycosyltransferase involved in cell wall biosynthesis
MTILFISDNFPPEVNAPATRIYEHCKEWVKLGAEVTVITCFPNFPQGKVYEGYKNKWKRTEWINGIKVIRVWSYMSPNEGFFKRLLDFNSFAITAFFTGLKIKTDIIISTSPQFFTSFPGYLLSKIKRSKWVFEIRDLWPESLWMLNRKSFIYRLFSWFEYFFYKKANLIVTVTESFKETLASNGIDIGKISIFCNGADFKVHKRNDSATSMIRSDLNLENKKIVGYIGTFGVAQNLPFFISCLKEISELYPELHFLFIGDGVDKEKMRIILDEKKYNNMTLLKPIPRENVKDYLSIIDYGLVPLRNNEVYHKVIPSKIFELAAMKIPILLGVEGEVLEIIYKYKIGLAFKPENKGDFIEKIGILLKDEKSLKSDYKSFSQDFNREIIAFNYLEALKKLNHGNN